MDASPPAVTVTSGPAIFFDGVTSVRRTANVALGLATMEIGAPDGEALAAWRYGELASYPAPDGMLRVGPATNPARLEIRDRDLAAAFTARAGRIRQLGTLDPRSRRKVVGWSLAAVASALLVAMFGIPATVERMAPLVPQAVEQRLGASVDSRYRASLVREHGEAFACGQGPTGEASRAALDKLVSRLETAAGLPFPVRVAVVRRAEDNAIALAGGHIYVFKGAINSVKTPDELAAVIAHEMGHLAHRDLTKKVVYAAGLWLLFGPLVGDFSGGATGWVAMHTVLLPSYSREREAGADAFSAELMLRIGRDPRALGDYLVRHGVSSGSRIEVLLRDHPERRERVAAVEAIARAAPNGGGNAASALLTDTEWAALKQICQAPKSTPPAAKAEPAPEAE
jgi:Zn-dependent protease with chaperone function